jgi:hypothetical protein
LKLEIRKVNDPIYEHEIVLKIPASSSEEIMLHAPLENHLENGSVAASNIIVHLLKDGHIVATNHYPHSYTLNQYAGYLVKIKTNDINPNNFYNKAITIVPTFDLAGTVPLHQ